MSPQHVAIVYDWADTRYGGAEQVLLALHELYPQATLFTSFVEPQATWVKKFKQVKTSFLQRWPKILRRHKKWLAVFLPFAFEQFDLSGFELVISVASFAAKGVLTKDNQLHICYLLTPTRFLYSHTGEYVRQPRWFTRCILDYLRRWDRAAASRPDKMIAISQLVAQRAAAYYGRQCDAVIYPTIIDKVKKTDNKEKNADFEQNFFLCVGRLTPYKHLDWVIDICGRRHWPLVVVGNGVQKKALTQKIAREQWAHIQLYSNLNQKLLQAYYLQALALIAPGLEDFGINLLEANQAQTLVVTHPQSGARELLTTRMAVDLDPQDTLQSLELNLERIYNQKKTDVPQQKLTKTEFARLWCEKVASYEKMSV